MSDSMTRFDKAKKWAYGHRRPLMCAFAIIAVIILIIGLSLSWFVNNMSLSTVGKIQTPAELKIYGPNKSPITTMEVSYDETRGDIKNPDGTVSIRRAFCVKSSKQKQEGGQPFEMQIANTTNIKNLTISVYKVDTNPGSGKADVVGLDGFNNTYAWAKSGNAIGFVFINAKDGSLAHELSNPDPTYETYTNVQKNARPIYRKHRFGKGELDGYNKSADTANDTTNFIIECTWNPSGDNAKETDMVYLIAK